MRRLGARLTLFPLFGLLVVAPSQETFGYSSDLFQQSTQEQRGAGSGTGGENDVQALEPGKPHRRRLAGGQQHTYRIRLAADQFLKAISLNGLARLHMAKNDIAQAIAFQSGALAVIERNLKLAIFARPLEKVKV